MRLVYNFTWGDFADWYIEIAKAAPSTATPRVLREVFSGILRLLHPVMPFATEEMSGVLGGERLLVREKFPSEEVGFEDVDAEQTLDRTRRAVSAVRKFRAESRVDEELEGLVPDGLEDAVFTTLAGVRPVEALNSKKAVLPAGDLAVEISLTEEQRRGEIERLRKEIERVGKEVERADKKLSNPNFVEKAPKEVVDTERDKLDVNTRMLETLSRRLEEYL